MISLKKPIEFEWDEGNLDKNLEKHKVSNLEAEEVFFDEKKRILKDILHSGIEERYLIIGKTKAGRALFIVFTQRVDKVRVISARDQNKKEYLLLGKDL
ncbi:MAG: hypothetical protein COU65_04240 [Candidatus Pacebacteria bacterium CG10_big_fil_rev_8_21_14_0_10_42_12]|nr:MAG: hypothetical protein COU65_04240 [Candidatus Pacebacteria bacterium CG10_big_fil_rev_8_21_14_0_10_42_12]